MLANPALDPAPSGRWTLREKPRRPVNSNVELNR